MRIRTREYLEGDDVNAVIAVAADGDEPLFAGVLHMDVGLYETLINLLDNTFHEVDRGPCADCSPHGSHLQDACFAAVYVDGVGMPCTCGDLDLPVPFVPAAVLDHDADVRAEYPACAEDADERAEARRG